MLVELGRIRRWWDKDCEHMLHSEKRASGDHSSPLMSRIPNVMIFFLNLINQIQLKYSLNS